VPLASVTDPHLVLEAIAATMPLRLPADVPLAEALPGLLKPRRDLLILDNLEQVTAAAPIIGNLLAATLSTVVLATSRLPLGLPDETTILIDPLPTPDARVSVSSIEALESPAVQLFVERAQAVKADFTLTPENAPAVVGICERLDGLPLAIELAAARIRVLAPDALLTRLDRSLSLLTGGARDLPTRQQTLRGAIQWSYDLLSPTERTVFARLAVMAPGFTTEAAARIFRDDADATDTRACLESLSEQSLLRRIVGEDGATRWDMLSTIHDFAREHLDTLREAEALRQAHARAYLAIADESEWFEVTNQPDLAAAFEADHDNYRLALRTLQDQGSAGTQDMLRLATMLADFWWIRGHTSEGRRWLESAIASAGGHQSLDLGRALAAAGLLAEAQSDLPAARRFQERALGVFRAEGYARGVADSLTGLAVIARAEGDLNRARVLHQEAYDVWTALGDEQGAAGALLDLGVVSYLRGDVGNAEPLLTSALEIFAAEDDLSGVAYARQSLAVIAAMRGDFAQAISGFHESLRIWQESGNEHMASIERTNLAEALLLNNEIVEAETLLLGTIDDLEEANDPGRKATALGILGRTRLALGNPSAAETILADALRLAWSVRDLAGCAAILDALAEVCVLIGDCSRARSLVGASNQLRKKTGIERLPAYHARLAKVTSQMASVSETEDSSPDSVIERESQRGLRR
jgi:predicted ATPase